MNAQQMCLIANLWSKKKTKPKDMLTFPEPKEPQSEEEMKKILQIFEMGMKAARK